MVLNLRLEKAAALDKEGQCFVDALHIQYIGYYSVLPATLYIFNLLLLVVGLFAFYTFEENVSQSLHVKNLPSSMHL